MMKTAFYVATAMLIAAPAIAQAQSVNHMVPGEGSRIPVVTRTTAQPPAALQMDPSHPGDGYRIAQVPRTSRQPLAGLQMDPSTPGDGYRIAPSRR